MTRPAHSKVGPSALHRILRCPGSLAACADVPPRSAGLPARLGTAVHALIEECLRNGEVDASGYVGTNWAQDDEGEIILTAHDVAGAQLALDEIWPHILSCDEYHVEVRLAMPDIDAEFFGTSDVVCVAPGMIHVIDYKNGRIHVNELENEQLQAYALGALKKFPHVKAREVRLTVVQPNSMEGGEPVRSVVYSVAELFGFGLEVQEGIAAARAPNAPRIPGTKQCQWCDARHVCPALYATVKSADAKYGFEHLTFDGLSTDELGERVALSKLTYIWQKALNDYARQRTVDGKPPTGFKPVAHGQKRMWAVSQDQVLAALNERFKGDASAFLETSVLSPTRVEAAVGKAQMKMLADIITKSNGWTLAPLDSKRPALDLASIADKSKQGFEVLEDN